jgi:hypothetical protein
MTVRLKLMVPVCCKAPAPESVTVKPTVLLPDVVGVPEI